MQLNLETKEFHLDHLTCTPVMQNIGRLQHADLLLQELSISIELKEARFECVMSVCLEGSSALTLKAVHKSPEGAVAECIDRLVDSKVDKQSFKAAS
jgi:hypothetical protein